MDHGDRTRTDQKSSQYQPVLDHMSGKSACTNDDLSGVYAGQNDDEALLYHAHLLSPLPDLPGVNLEEM